MILLKTIFLILFFFGVNSQNDDSYRLKDNVDVESYILKIAVTDSNFLDNEVNNFFGSVTIKFTLKSPVREIILHSSKSYINIQLLQFDGKSLEYTIDEEREFLKITSPEEIPNGEHSLLIAYQGTLSTKDMYGFYKSYYEENGKKKYILTTQFQPTHARRAFPCFDEPQYKATFKISITHPSNLIALSNTKGISTDIDETTKQTDFEETTRMSTYLVAFIISDFTNSENKDSSVPFNVWSRESSKETRKLATQIGPVILKELSDYTDIPYQNAMGKMDQVAIPDFAAGAMENWGLVTYRETALLWDEVESSNRYRQRVATVIGHEFAHMWFGNLVTTKWWSTTFLNEGFATLFEFLITDLAIKNNFNESWELENQMVLEDVQVALQADSLLSVQALDSSVSTPTDISDKFTTISYSKGGSILRMVMHILGRQNFQRGLRDYLKTHKNGVTTPNDLWKSLEKVVLVGKLPTQLIDVMKNWIESSGFPLITVTSSDNSVILSQKRYLLAEEDKTTKWYVPVSYTLSNFENKFERTSPNLWLTPEDNTKSIPLGSADWIILNNQQTGYYRVNYDKILWEKIKEALLKENFDGIHKLNRAQIIDDLFNLARIGEVTYPDMLEIVSFLKNDVDYFSWYSYFEGFSFLLKRIDSKSSLGMQLSEYTLKLLTKVYESVAFEENFEHLYTHKQVMVLTWACKLGEKTCVSNATSLFQNYKSEGKKPSKNLRAIVYCNGLRYSTNDEDWKFLWEEFQNSPIATEQITLISALGCTRKKELLQQFLQYSIDSNSKIRPQDAASVFSAVYSGNSEGVDIAFDFLIEHQTEINSRYSGMNALGNLIKGVAERFTNEQQLQKLSELIKTLNNNSLMKKSAEEAYQSAKANVEWTKSFGTQIDEYFKSGSDIRTSSFILYFALALILIFRSR